MARIGYGAVGVHRARDRMGRVVGRVGVVVDAVGAGAGACADGVARGDRARAAGEAARRADGEHNHRGAEGRADAVADVYHKHVVPLHNVAAAVDADVCMLGCCGRAVVARASAAAALGVRGVRVRPSRAGGWGGVPGVRGGAHAQLRRYRMLRICNMRS